MDAKITKVEIHKHLWLPHFCAKVYVGDYSDAAVRFDTIDRTDLVKVSGFKSTLETRVAGIDKLVAISEYGAANLLETLELIKLELEQSP